MNVGRFYRYKSLTGSRLWFYPTQARPSEPYDSTAARGWWGVKVWVAKTPAMRERYGGTYNPEKDTIFAYEEDEWTIGRPRPAIVRVVESALGRCIVHVDCRDQRALAEACFASRTRRGPSTGRDRIRRRRTR